jgi:C-methyltransferase-like protein/methyltransferase family protein/putative zinc binding protein
MNCRVCDSRDLALVLDLGTQALTGVFPKPGEDVQSGPLRVLRCATCGLAQLDRTYPLEVMYGPSYGYRSGLNPAMVGHLRRIVHRFAPRLKPGDTVIDIGSSDGTLLGYMPQYCTRIGIDPSAARWQTLYPHGVQAVAGFFPEAAPDAAPAALITSIAMFYDLDDPVDFARAIVSRLAPDGVWFTEQAHLPTMITNTAFDAVCHEHIEYYGLNDIRNIAEAAGLRVRNVTFTDTNGGSFGVILGRAEDGGREWPELDAQIAAERELVSAGAWSGLAERAEAETGRLRAMLVELASDGKRVAGYGASTKGNVLLQYTGLGPDLVPEIVDVNPEKVGRVTPGTGIPIVAEPTVPPDVLLVLPWHFRRFFLEKEAGFLAKGGKMLFPLPHCEIVP